MGRLLEVLVFLALNTAVIKILWSALGADVWTGLGAMPWSVAFLLALFLTKSPES